MFLSGCNHSHTQLKKGCFHQKQVTHPYRSDLVNDFTFSLNFCLVAGLGLTQFLMTCESKHELQKKAKYLLLSECRSLLAIKIN